jgi:hypothetical protein
LVVAKLPDGVMPMPFWSVLVLVTEVPLLSVVCCVLLELEPPISGAGVAVVDWVDVVLDDEVCAPATPVIIARAVAAANQYLIMSSTPKNCLQAEIVCCSVR